MLEITRAELISPDLETLPVMIENFFLNGEPISRPSVQPVITTPASVPAVVQLPVWFSTGGILLGVVALLLFVVWRRFKTDGGQATAEMQVEPRKIPGDGRSHTQIAALLTIQGNHALSEGQVDQAYELFSRAIELDPANTEAWLGKGLVAQHCAEKQICFERVLALDPQNIVALTNLEQLKVERRNDQKSN